jgi:hypothetical protein
VPSDIPQELTFVSPDETEDTWRVCLWAAPGQGKSVAAASAPAPILLLTADRPSAYKFARRHHKHTADSLREVRYRDAFTLDHIIEYLRGEGRDVKTVIVDPVSNVYDQLVDTAPRVNIKGQDSPNYQTVNKKLLGFVKTLRGFDVNVVLVAHERLQDGEGEAKMYPALGGPALIGKLLAEMDIVAHIERVERPTEDDPDAAVWTGRMQPHGNLVVKDGTGSLGAIRVADLTRWFEVASSALAAPAEQDLPWGDQTTIDEQVEQPPAGVGSMFDPDLED